MPAQVLKYFLRVQCTPELIFLHLCWKFSFLSQYLTRLYQKFIDYLAVLDYDNDPHLKIYGLTSQFEIFQPIQIRHLSSGCWYVFTKFWQFFLSRPQENFTMAHIDHGTSLCKRLFVIWRYSGGCTISHITFVENTDGAVVSWYWVDVPSARILRTGHSYSGESIDCPLGIHNKTYVAYSAPTRVPSKYGSLFAWRWTMDCARLCKDSLRLLADGTKKIAKIWWRHISSLNSRLWSEWVEIYQIGKSIHISSNEDSCRSPTVSIHQ